jgi:hypothetical protein
VALSADTTEGDLKQRREIIHGSVQHLDQPPVIAATQGRILILEGSYRRMLCRVSPLHDT